MLLACFHIVSRWVLCLVGHALRRLEHPVQPGEGRAAWLEKRMQSEHGVCPGHLSLALSQFRGPLSMWGRGLPGRSGSFHSSQKAGWGKSIDQPGEKVALTSLVSISACTQNNECMHTQIYCIYVHTRSDSEKPIVLGLSALIFSFVSANATGALVDGS